MRICNAYTGRATEIDADSVVSIDGLKRQLAAGTEMEPDNLLLLLAPGAAQFKLERIGPNVQAYMYDRQLIANSDVARSRADLHDSQYVDGDKDLSSSQKLSKNQEVMEEITEIDKATQLAWAHMNTHLRSVARTLRTRREQWQAIREDTELCHEWPSVLAQAKKVPILCEWIPQIINEDELPAKFEQLQRLSTNVETDLREIDADTASLRARAGVSLTSMSVRPDLPPVASTDLGAWRLAKRNAQDRLVQALGEVAAVQHRVGELRHPLASIGETLHVMDGLKVVVAQAVDMPFLVGALLIERCRRSQWKSELDAHVEAAKDRFELLREAELARIDQWNHHYRDKSVIRRLGPVEKVSIPHISFSINSTPKDESGLPSIHDYIDQLDAAGLSETASDLIRELNAMKAQLAKSLTLPPLAEAKSQYDARIRQLERALLQLRTSPSSSVTSVKATNSSEKPTTSPLQPERSPTPPPQAYSKLIERATKVSQQLWHNVRQYEEAINGMGLRGSTEDGNYEVSRVKGLSRSPPPVPAEPAAISWARVVTESEQAKRFAEFEAATNMNYEAVREAVSRRFDDVTRLARKLQTQSRQQREQTRRIESELRQRVALHSFRGGDLILFLPTRDPARQPNPWAAFNAGAPHYFLHPDHARLLNSREYLIARAAAVEPRKVSHNDDIIANPFGLAVGTEWFLITVQGEWGV